jgi:molecular chaperone IbpA
MALKDNPFGKAQGALKPVAILLFQRRCRPIGCNASGRARLGGPLDAASSACRFKGGYAMRTFDLSPLYRSTVGFDRLFSMLDNTAGFENGGTTYPPYNIERTGDNSYRVTIAVAGFSESDLSIEAKENTLTVKGEKHPEKDERPAELLYQGIAARAFERIFKLAEFVEVKAAKLEKGLLHIDLVREIPEAMKPRTIRINGSGGKAIDAKAA